MTLINYDSKCFDQKKQQQQHMKIARQCGKTAFVTLAQKFGQIVYTKFFCLLFTLWHSSIYVVEKFIDKANKHHPTIKFTAEISCTDATSLDTTIYKGQRFCKESVLDMRTHFKPTETFQYTFFTSCHPQGVKKGFVKGETLRLLRLNKLFIESIWRKYYKI